MLERNQNYQFSRTAYELNAVNSDVFEIRTISLTPVSLIEIGKKNFNILDKEDSSFLELFVDDRLIRLDYNGTVPGTRDSDILFLRGYLGCCANGGGGGGGLTEPVEVEGTVSVDNFPTSFDVGNFPTSFSVDNFPPSDKVKSTVAVINHNATTSWVSVLPINAARNYLAIKNNGSQRIQVRYNGGNPETFLPGERMTLESNFIITSQIEIRSVVGTQQVDIIHS